MTGQLPMQNTIVTLPRSGIVAALASLLPLEHRVCLTGEQVIGAIILITSSLEGCSDLGDSEP